MLSLAALLLLYMSAPTPAAAQTDVDPVVARTARQWQWSDTGSVRHVTLRGEGRTLIWAGEIAPDWMGPVLPADLAPVIANIICSGSGGAAFFTEGRTLRVEIRPVAGASTSATVDRCLVPGQGLDTAAGAASIMQSLVGIEEDGVSITSVRAEGDTVVLAVDGPAGWLRGTIAEMLERGLVREFCSQAETRRAFLEGRVSFRIDTLEGGRDPVRGRTIASCPAQ